MTDLKNNQVELELEDDSFILFNKISDKDKYNFYEYLAIMLNS
jgi:hypothetical protein